MAGAQIVVVRESAGQCGQGQEGSSGLYPADEKKAAEDVTTASF